VKVLNASYFKMYYYFVKLVFHLRQVVMMELKACSCTLRETFAAHLVSLFSTLAPVQSLVIIAL